MSEKDGGPAFPTTPWEGESTSWSGDVGMLLRDYFAAAAFQQAYSIAYQGRSGNPDAADIAYAAYLIADAMLKEREK